jgi:hypothetical protein
MDEEREVITGAAVASGRNLQDTLVAHRISVLLMRTRPEPPTWRAKAVTEGGGARVVGAGRPTPFRVQIAAAGRQPTMAIVMLRRLEPAKPQRGEPETQHDEA